jgi:hypothetical protein
MLQYCVYRSFTLAAGAADEWASIVSGVSSGLGMSSRGPCLANVIIAETGWVMLVEITPAFKQRRAADTARWRERLRRGAAV